MDLIVYQMMQLQIMHVSDGYRAVEILTGTAISQTYFTVSGDRYAFPYFSVLSVFIEIIYNLRKQIFPMITFECFAIPRSSVCGLIKFLLFPLCSLCIIEWKVCVIIRKIKSIHDL